MGLGLGIGLAYVEKKYSKKIFVFWVMVNVTKVQYGRL